MTKTAPGLPVLTMADTAPPSHDAKHLDKGPHAPHDANKIPADRRANAGPPHGPAQTRDRTAQPHKERGDDN